MLPEVYIVLVGDGKVGEGLFKHLDEVVLEREAVFGCNIE